MFFKYYLPDHLNNDTDKLIHAIRKPTCVGVESMQELRSRDVPIAVVRRVIFARHHFFTFRYFNLNNTTWSY